MQMNGSIQFPAWMSWALLAAGAAAMLTAGALLNLGWLAPGATPDRLRGAALAVGICCLGFGLTAIMAPYAAVSGLRDRGTQ